MDWVNDENMKKFEDARTYADYSKFLEDRQNILVEFNQNGVLDLYSARRRGNTFHEEVTELSNHDRFLADKTIAEQAALMIASAPEYDLSNPQEVKIWLEKIAPFINNWEINIDAYSHIIKSDILANPIIQILNELENQNYHFIMKTDNQEKDEIHNKVVNAYQNIANPDFLNEPLEFINSQLEIVTPYLSESLRINGDQLKSKKQSHDKSLPIISKIHEEGMTNTIISLLKENGYDKEVVSDLNTEIGEYNGYITEDGLEHNIIHNMYLEILQYGFLARNLKAELDNHDKLFYQALESEEMTNFLTEIETRNNKSTKTVKTEGPKKKLSITSLFERFINRNHKLDEEMLSEEENIVVQNLEDLNACNTFSEFASILRTFKNYLNNPKKPLNLSNGRNVLQEILEKAESLGYNDNIEISQILKNNPEEDRVLVRYCLDTLSELENYGCFVSSKCNEIIKSNRNVIHNGNEQMKSEQDYLTKLVNLNNQILEHTGEQKGQRVFEIQEEIKALNEKMTDIQPDQEKFNNALNLIETITKSEVKGNNSFSELLNNLIKQRKNQVQELQNSKNQLLMVKESLGKSVLDEFSKSYVSHAENLKKFEAENPNEKEEIDKQKKRLGVYQKLKNIFVANENIKKDSIDANNNSTMNLSEIEALIEKQTTILLDMRELIENVKVESILEQSDISIFDKVYEISRLSLEIEKKEYESQMIYSEVAELQAYNAPKIDEFVEIKDKIKQLEIEESMLSMNPEVVEKEIRDIINRLGSREEIEAKLDQLITPIIEFNAPKKEQLNGEISELKTKINDSQNYLDSTKINLKQQEKEAIEQEIKAKQVQIEELQKQVSKQDEYDALVSHKTILTNQATNYEEEKQLLLQWNIEESESTVEVRNALLELFEQNKENISQINSEISSCENTIEQLEKEITEEKEVITSQIQKLEEEKKVLENKSQTITEMLEEKSDLQLIDSNKKLEDIKELLNKQKQLAELESIETLKDEYLSKIDLEIQTKKQATLSLPGELEDGKQLLSDGRIVDEKPKDLPAVMQRNLFDLELDESELENIIDPKTSLLAKAKATFLSKGKKVLDYLKAHPFGAVLAVITGGAIAITALVSSMIGKNDKDLNINVQSAITQTVSDITNNGIDIAVNIANEKANKIQSENETKNNNTTLNQTKNTFEEEYDHAVDNILAEDKVVYTSADKAILNQNAKSFGDLYISSFENADLGAIYKMEDGKLIKIGIDEAAKIVENGGTVGVTVENEGTGIGFISVGGDQIVKQNNSGILK